MAASTSCACRSDCQAADSRSRSRPRSKPRRSQTGRASRRSRRGACSGCRSSSAANPTMSRRAGSAWRWSPSSCRWRSRSAWPMPTAPSCSMPWPAVRPPRRDIRFGDIVVGLNGRAVANIERPAPARIGVTPGSEAQVEVWRIAADDGEFLQMLRRLADGGNTHVMYRLGRMYAAGTGTARDEAEAVRWYRKASDAGNVERHRGARRSRCIEGRGTAIDQQEGLRLLRAAAAKDHIGGNEPPRPHPARGQDRREGHAGDGAPVHQGGGGRPRPIDGGHRRDVRQRRRRADGLRQGRHVVQPRRRSRQRPPAWSTWAGSTRTARASRGRHCQGRHVVPAGSRSRQRLRHGGPGAAVLAGQGRAEGRGYRGRAQPQGREPRQRRWP